jgi:UDP-N-acetylmuramoylalanine--D-glutamate ligase
VDSLRLPGIHNVENALAAAAAAIAFGVEVEAVERALRGFAGVPHRMEVVQELDGVLYINNSMCTNIAAAICSLEAVGRPVIVIAGGVDKNSDFTPFGAALARYARHVVLMGRAAEKIEVAARMAGFTAISKAQSMEEAVALASRIAQPGDAVLLSPACASFDMFRDFETRGEAFRQAVRALAA